MAEYSVLLKGQENMKAALKSVFGGAFSDDGVTEDKAIFVKQKVVCGKQCKVWKPTKNISDRKL